MSGKSNFEGNKDLLDCDALGIFKSRCPLKYLEEFLLGSEIIYFALNMYQYLLFMILLRYILYNLFRLWEIVGHGPKINRKLGLPLFYFF